MTPAATVMLDARLTEVLMSALAPCDLGDGIEVVHDVEAVEIEMECMLDDEPATAADDDNGTTRFARDLGADELGTHQFVRYSAPYERIEAQLDANAFVRATIEEARTLRSR